MSLPILSTQTLSDISSKVSKPVSDFDKLPVKVIQFGSGNFLRGFADFFIDKANRQGIFNGRIVVVQSTTQGAKDSFATQDYLYTLLEQGIQEGKPTRQYSIISAIKECLSAQTQWEKVLEYAENPDISVILSNTTEAGVVLDKNDSVSGIPPVSFPAKLTAVLYRRWQKWGNDAPGFTILPCELLVDNGSKLRQIVLELAKLHKLSSEFVAWVSDKNAFCNTLVDRIVPGKPADLQSIFEQIGYIDDMLTACEFYRLWAIEGSNELLEKVPFLKVDSGIIVRSDITPYRELKLRILNGGHTIAVAFGFLKGFITVDECLEDTETGVFFENVIRNEIAVSLPFETSQTLQFANDVLMRFRNPFLHHQLLSICLEYTMKMRMRNIPTFFRYYEKFGKVPVLMCKGFAAYLVFMHNIREENGKYFGVRNGKKYVIQDSQAAYWVEKIKSFSVDNLNRWVESIAKDTTLWEQDLTVMNGFVETVSKEMLDLL